MIQGPTNVSCGRPEQVGFPVGQVTFHFQLPERQAPKKSSADKLTNIGTLSVQELFFQLIGWLGVELGVSPVGMVYFMG